MAKENKFKKEDANLESVETALSTTGQWIEKHKNAISWSVLCLLIVVLGYMLIKAYVIEPKAAEAANAMSYAQECFEAGDYQIALEGGNRTRRGPNGEEAVVEVVGFAEIADSYGLYQQGKLASLYAGICSYKLGIANMDTARIEASVEYLSKFSANDALIAPAAKQLEGDAHAFLGNYEKAVKAYEKVASTENPVLAPESLKKAGIIYLEKLGDKAAALKAFTQIQDKYYESVEAQTIDKFIELSK